MRCCLSNTALLFELDDSIVKGTFKAGALADLFNDIGPHLLHLSNNCAASKFSLSSQPLIWAGKSLLASCVCSRRFRGVQWVSPIIVGITSDMIWLWQVLNLGGWLTKEASQIDMDVYLMVLQRRVGTQEGV